MIFILPCDLVCDENQAVAVVPFVWRRTNELGACEVDDDDDDEDAIWD